MRIALAFILLLPTFAQADPIAEGMAAFEALDYERAVELLQQAFTDSLAHEDKVTVLRALAFAHVALNASDQARAEFRLLLRLEPATVLDATISPRARLIFEEAKAEVAPHLPTPPPPPPPEITPALPSLQLTEVGPPQAKTPWLRNRWLWGGLAGASVTAILIGTLAGVLAPPSAHVVVARP